MNADVILFADNDPRFLKARKELLEREGYHVIGANTLADAQKILEEAQIDLAILDMRMLDDTNERDISGLILAKETNPDVPKIILTGFPNWEAVKDALGPDLNGVPAAADFISKQEGAGAMLQAVEFTLRRPQLKGNVLQAFQVTTLMALPDRMDELGPDEAGGRLQRSFEATSRELTQYREQENRRANQYHRWGLTMAVLGMLLVLAGALLILLNYANSSAFPTIASVILEAIGILFFSREQSAYKRVNAYFTQLNELNNLGNLLAICDSLGSNKDREMYKKKVLDKVIHRWFSQ